MSDPQPPPPHLASQPPPQPPPQPPAAPPTRPPMPPNPYGGAPVVDPYAAARRMQPGAIGYVEAHFGPVATFGDRVVALLIDTVVGIVAFVPFVVGLGLFIGALPRSTTYDAYGDLVTSGGNTALAVTGGVVMALGLLTAVAVGVWNRIWRMGRTGQSIGKSRTGLMLLDARTGRPIGAGMCFLRELVSGAVNQVVYLSYLWMLWDEDRQTLADKVVHSAVVKVPRA